VEVPKTASTSIRSILGNPEEPHLDIWQIHQELEKTYRSDGLIMFQQYYKFGFVRNPWARVVSLYNRKEGLQLKDKMSFKEFIEWINLSSDTCIYPSPHRYQLDWFLDPQGKIIMDFIGKFENLQSDWKIVCNHLHILCELPLMNQNPNRVHYTKYYTPMLVDLIAQKFHVDIKHFNYKFGDD
jgi:hypothetical protein